MLNRAYGIWHVECIYGSVGYTSEISLIHPWIPPDTRPITPFTPQILQIHQIGAAEDRGVGVSGVHLGCIKGVHMGCIWGVSGVYPVYLGCIQCNVPQLR